MMRTNKKSSDAGSLRLKAEEELKKRRTGHPSFLTEADSVKLIHELEVHQIELQMQNEELKEAIDKAETATALYDFAPAGYFTLNAIGIINGLNLAAARMLGIERAGLVNRNLLQFITPDTLPAFNNFLRNIFKTNSRQTCEIRLTSVAHPSIYAHIEGICAQDEQKCHLVAVDISERKKAEEKLRYSEQQFKSMVDTSPLAIYMSSGLEQKALYMNPTFHRLFGYTIDDLQTISEWWLLAYPNEKYRQEIAAMWQKKVAYAMKTNTATEPIETTVTCKDGSTKYISWGYVSTGLLNWTFGLDLTERKLAEERIRVSEARLRQAEITAGFGHWELHPDNQLLIISEGARRIYGLSQCELTFAEMKKISLPEYRTLLNNSFKTLIHNTKRFDVEFKIRTEDTREIKDIHSFALFNREKKTVLGIIQDITERKRSQESLRKSEIKYRRLHESMMDGYAYCDMKGNIRECNESYQQMLGYSAEELGHLNYKDLTPAKWHAFEEEIMDKQILPKGYSEVYEKEYERKDGTIFPVELRTYVVRNDSGEYEGMWAIIRDITERKKAEEKISRLNEVLEEKVIERTAQLQTVNKELEAFSYTVSHDLRAPLRALKGFARILSIDYQSSLDPEGKRLLDVIMDNTRKMSNLIDDLLSFSRLGRQEMKLMMIDMHTMADSVIHEIVPKPVKSRIKFNLLPLPAAFGDPSMVRQVWINLIGNAVKFTSKMKKSSIEIGANEMNGEIIYYIKDNGVGFNMKFYDKLFGVFQRLHSELEFEGSGVGLAIVQRIIMRLNGRIWAESETGQGATFYFFLPDHRQ